MTTNASIERTLGSLLAEVKNLRDDFKESQTKSDESRASMHKRMDALVDRVGKVEGRLEPIEKDVADTKAVTEEVKRWKLMGFGALGMAGIGGTAIGVGLANSFDWLAKLFRGAG